MAALIESIGWFNFCLMTEERYWPSNVLQYFQVNGPYSYMKSWYSGKRLGMDEQMLHCMIEVTDYFNWLLVNILDYPYVFCNLSTDWKISALVKIVSSVICCSFICKWKGVWLFCVLRRFQQFYSYIMVFPEKVTTHCTSCPFMLTPASINANPTTLNAKEGSHYFHF